MSYDTLTFQYTKSTITIVMLAVELVCFDDVAKHFI